MFLKYLFLLSSLFLSLALCFPQTLSFFVFIFLIPIILYIDKNNLVFSKKREVVNIFFKMFTFIFLALSVSSFWVAEAFPLDWLGINNYSLSLFIVLLMWFLFVFVMSLPMSFWILFVYKFKTDNIIFNALMGSSVWVSLEYLRSWIVAFAMYGDETLFGPHHAYYSLAYTVSNIPIIRDLLPMGGIYLTSFVIVLINFFIYGLVFGLNRGKSKLLMLFFMILFILISSFYIIRHVRSTNTLFKKINTIVINTNLPSSSNKELIEHKNELSFSILNKIKIDDSLIVFPENFNPLGKNELENKSNLIVGSFKNQGFYNMFFWKVGDESIGFYRKQLLMPLGEYNVSILGLFLFLINNKEWEREYNYKIHKSKKEEGVYFYNYKDIRISGSLCSENISPYIHRNAVLSGSNVLINIASHAPFHGSLLLARQTLAINTTRALETGRYLITASNYGNSFILDDEGNILNLIKNREEYVYFESYFESKDYITPYVKYGDYFAYLSVIFVLLNFVWVS